MKTFFQSDPLTDAELDRLGEFLMGCKGGRAMNVEQLDGFYAALIAGPETVMPSEYYSEVFGGEMSEACEFGSLDEANEILGLMMRHWNTIAGTLFKGEVYVPLLLADENGVVNGNDWAQGFMRGMHMRHDGWAELVNDEKHGGCLIPMMMLCHEHDEDPKMHPEAISREQREDVIAHMAAGLSGAYRYFRAQREADAGTTFTHEPRRTEAKIGRNDPCPCGSGKKYKRRCGGAAVTDAFRAGHLSLRSPPSKGDSGREAVAWFTGEDTHPRKGTHGYHLATISGKIRMVECAIVDGKTVQPNWNSLKNLRIAVCLSGVRRVPPSPPLPL